MSLDSSALFAKAAEKIYSWHSKNYPKNLLLLPVLLLLNHLVAIVELLSAIWINSLGLFSHGSHMIFNSIVLTGLITSVFVNWQDKKRYTITYIHLVVRTNFVVGVIFLSNSIVVGYMSVLNAIEPPEIRYESLVYLIPVPALLLNLVSIYVILHDEDKEDDQDERKRVVVDKDDELEVCKSAKTICHHILANALGSIGTIVSTVLVQILGWTAADTVSSIFTVFLMSLCAVYLIKESIDLTIAIRNKQPDVFTVSSYMKREIQQFTNIFTV